MQRRALASDPKSILTSAALTRVVGFATALFATSLVGCNTYDPSLLTASADAEGQDDDDDTGPMPISAFGEGGQGNPPPVGPSGEGGNAGQSNPDVTTPDPPPPGPEAGGSGEGGNGSGGLAGAPTAPTSSASAGGSDAGGNDSGAAGNNASNAGEGSGGNGGDAWSAAGGGGTDSGGTASGGAAGASVAGAGGAPMAGAGGEASAGAGGVGSAGTGAAGEANGGAGGAVDPDACDGCARLSVPLDASGDQAHFTLTLPSATNLSAAVLTFRVLRVAGSGGSFRAYVQQGTGGSFAYRTSAATPLANISAAGADVEWDLATVSDFDLTAIARIGIEITANGGTTWTNPTVMQIDRIDVVGGSPAVTSYTFDAASSVHVTPVETYQPGPLWLNSYSADTTATGSAISWIGP